MRYDEIVEMTQRVASYEGGMKKQFNAYVDDLKSFQLCGHISSNYDVYKNDNYSSTQSVYLILDDSVPIAYSAVSGRGEVELLHVYVIPEKRKGGIASMFLVFLRRHEGVDKIILSSQHSNDTIAFVRALFNKGLENQFKIYWENGTTQEPYDPDAIDNYYSLVKPTGWNLVMENECDDHSYPFPRYRETKFGVAQNLSIFYESLFEGLKP